MQVRSPPKETGVTVRADAIANREAIIATAIALWADVGTGVSLRTIASNAGVGIGTLYRHFPTKDDLVRGVIDAVGASIGRIADRYEQGRGTDPTSAWRGFVTEMIDLRLGRLISRAVADPDPRTDEWMDSARRQVLRQTDVVLAHAKADGLVREDVDAMHLQIGISQLSAPLTDYVGRLAPDWDSWLADVFIRGLRPSLFAETGGSCTSCG